MKRRATLGSPFGARNRRELTDTFNRIPAQLFDLKHLRAIAPAFFEVGVAGLELHVEALPGGAPLVVLELDLAWITGENRLVWWELREEEYQEIAPAEDGLLKSGTFPGLWLDTTALLRGDLKGALAALRRGLDSAEHRAFVAT